MIEHYEFLQLGVKDLASLLNNEDLFVDQEEDIFSALMKWYKHDPVNRKEHLGHLMSFVKLPLMSASFLTDHVEPVCAGKFCIDLLNGRSARYVNSMKSYKSE